jgi:1-deoxy-D-xylulose-5-phosphate synthase
MLDELAKDHDVVITLEEHVYQGGFGQMVSSYYMQKSKEYPNITVRNIAINDTFVEHGSVTQLREMLGIDYESVLSVICEYL